MDFKEELIKNAVRAPSGHNTQPWKFKVKSRNIEIHPDLSRSLPVVDSDNHALWISLGCALENMFLTAKKYGNDLTYNIVSNDVSGDGGKSFIEVKINDGKTEEDDLSGYIAKRQSTRNEYSSEEVKSQDIRALESSVYVKGVDVKTFINKDIELLRPLIIEGSDLQFKNKKFVKELVSWLRFNEKEAEETKDGLWTASMGIKQMKRFIGNIVMRFFVSAKSEAKRWNKLINNSFGFALFTVNENNKQHWVSLGRAFQRFDLTATKLNLSHSHVNMPCEEVSVRRKMVEKLKLKDKIPLLLIRFGYSEKMPYSFRRPLQDVLIDHGDGGTS